MLHIYHLTLKTSKICLSGTQDLHGKMIPNIYLLLKKEKYKSHLGKNIVSRKHFTEYCRKAKKGIPFGHSRCFATDKIEYKIIISKYWMNNFKKRKCNLIVLRFLCQGIKYAMSCIGLLTFRQTQY